jgi:benzylsuccinate CoA-transferase BbsF subunit
LAGLGPPLAGVRVLDFGHIVAGPYCARLLADLGADVVKIESRSRVEGTGRSRLGEDYKGRRDRSPHMLMTNRNRRSVTLNLKTPSGAEVGRRLAASADVVVENFSAGTMAGLGLGYEDVAPSNPGLVYLSLSGYGHEGPRRDWTSMNLNLQAYSGLMMTTGEEGDPPTTIAVSWNDYLGALHGCVAILNALLERRKTGRGAKLDLSQFECSVASLAPLLIASAISGRAPARAGNRSETALAQGCYRCAGEDEWCAISVQTREQWQALVSVVPGLGTDPEADADARIGAWAASRSAAEVEACLHGAGVPAERMRRTRDLLDATNAGQLFRSVEDPPGYKQLMAALPLAFSRSATAAPDRAPLVGEHTKALLQEWLAFSDAELDRLDAEGALA